MEAKKVRAGAIIAISLLGLLFVFYAINFSGIRCPDAHAMISQTSQCDRYFSPTRRYVVLVTSRSAVGNTISNFTVFDLQTCTSISPAYKGNFAGSDIQWDPQETYLEILWTHATISCQPNPCKGGVRWSPSSGQVLCEWMVGYGWMEECGASPSVPFRKIK